MENVILCNGKYAINPYFLEEDNLHIYSIEELCYYLYKNAFLIQDEFFTEALLDWIDTELGLADWVAPLRMIKGKEDAILRSMEFLFRATGYCTEEEVEHVRSVFKDSNHLSVAERKKLRADAHCKRQQYVMAGAEYAQLLKETDENEKAFRAKLYHNLGVCQSMLFLYEKAADSFMKAFHTYPNTESYVQFLTALKLSNSQEKYLTWLSEHPESYEDSLEVESRIARIEKAWERMPFADMLQDMMDDSDETYYGTLKQLLKQAKTDYINMVNKR